MKFGGHLCSGSGSESSLAAVGGSAVSPCSAAAFFMLISCVAYSSTLQIEVTRSSEKSVYLHRNKFLQHKILQVYCNHFLDNFLRNFVPSVSKP